MAYRVFISYKYSTMDGKGVTRDFTLAKDLYAALTRAGVKTFFSEKELYTGDFVNEIYEALEEADILIVVGTRPEYIRSDWVKDEYTSFVAELNGSRKPNGDIYTYLDGMKVNDLPSMLYKRQSYTPGDRDTLVKRIINQLGTGSTVLYTPQPKVMPQTAPAPRVRVGEPYRFGQYPQGAKGEVKPLIWRVLAVENGRALLVTEKLIDYAVYKSNWFHASWKNASLRDWLNDVFFTQAFNPSQQSQIAVVTHPDPDGKGDGTQDRIFALSVEEAQQYFRSDADRKATVTDYAHNRGYDQKDRSEYWWLRSPGKSSNYAAFVTITGKIDLHGSLVNLDKVAVRPACWVLL